MPASSNFAQSQYKSKTIYNNHNTDFFKDDIHNPLGQDEYDDFGLEGDCDSNHSTLYHSQEYL